VAIDVTERRKMEAELRRAQRMESVGNTRGWRGSRLQQPHHRYQRLQPAGDGGTPTAPSVNSQLQEIDAAATKAEGLTRQLLAFSRQQVMQPRVTNLNDIVKGIEKMLGRLIGADIQVVVLLATNLESVRVDPGQVEQAIMNLAANARDAMPRGGKLTISTTNTFGNQTVLKTVSMRPKDVT